MRRFWHTTAYITDRLIPYCLIILLTVIILEITFTEQMEPYHAYVVFIDSFIIVIFVIDLIFKYLGVRDIPVFFKRYWPEIIAVFPAFLFVRFIEEVALIVNLDQKLLITQDSLEVGERTLIQANRTHYFSRFMPLISRIPRFFKAFHFYEKPIHHPLK